MNAEYINPFLEAANLVFKQMLGLNLLRGKTSIKQNPMPGRDIAMLLGVNGRVNGEVIYALNIETVYKIVRKLMPDVDNNSIQEEYRDIMGELANMITGNALNTFLEKNADIDVSVPMVVDVRTSASDLKFKDRPTLGLNLYSRFGMLEVLIALSDNSRV